MIGLYWYAVYKMALSFLLGIIRCVPLKLLLFSIIDQASVSDGYILVSSFFVKK